MIKFLALILLVIGSAYGATTTTNKVTTPSGNLTLDTATSSSTVDVVSKFKVTSTTKGSIPCPVMTEVQRNAISSPVAGDCIYNSTTKVLNFYNGSEWRVNYETPTNLPIIRPTLNLDFANSKTLDPRITFSRASKATRVNEFGLIEEVEANVPRFDHDPDTLESKGLLIEESRTNLLTHSNQFDNGAWSKFRASIIPNVATAPDGSLTASKLVEDTTPANYHALEKLGIPYASGTSYVISIFAKAAERSVLMINYPDSVVGGVGHGVFNLTTGESSIAGNGTTETKMYPDGWVRCSVTITSLVTTASSNFQYLVAKEFTTNYTNAVIYDGDGSSGIYIWGAQLEVGSFPTSYIPTEGTPVTREADNVLIPDSIMSELWNPNEFTLITDARYAINTGATTTAASLYVNSENRLRILLNNSDSLRASGRVGESVTRNAPVLTTLTQQDQRAVCALFAKNGEQFGGAMSDIVTQASTGNTGVFTGTPTMFIGSYRGVDTGSGETYINGTISRISLYPKRLTNSELQAVTK